MKIGKGMLFLGYVAGLFLIIVSMVFTAILFESMATGTTLGKVLAVSGICVDIGKIVSCTLMIVCVSRGNYSFAGICLAFYIGCFGISMWASQSLDLNKANEIRQSTLVSSDGYKRSTESYEDDKKKIVELQVESNQLKNSKDQKVNESLETLKSERARALKNSWITTPSGSPRRGVDVIDADIAQIREKTSTNIDNQISNIKSRIDVLEGQKASTKQELSGLKDTGIVSTQGIYAMAEWVYSQGWGSSAQDVVAKFYIFKNIFTELLGTFLMMAAGMKLDEVPGEGVPQRKKLKDWFGEIADKIKIWKSGQTDTKALPEVQAQAQIAEEPEVKIIPKEISAEPETIPEVKEISAAPKKTYRLKPATAKLESHDNADVQKDNRRQIGFDTGHTPIPLESKNPQSQSGIDKTDILKYIDYMYANKKNDESPGYHKIRSNTRIEPETVRKIKGTLETLGILKVDGSRTLILMDKESCLKSVR
jgi:hypothetical protein